MVAAWVYLVSIIDAVMNNFTLRGDLCSRIILLSKSWVRIASSVLMTEIEQAGSDAHLGAIFIFALLRFLSFLL
jgi:hypothetical protein